MAPRDGRFDGTLDGNYDRHFDGDLTSARHEIDNAMPFSNASEAWFWFIAAQQAREDGARFVAGQGLYNRPCEPMDILKAVDRLYRNRRLMRDHLLVMRHYGRRHMAPDPRRVKEQRAHYLWVEAMQRLEDVLSAKGIVSAAYSAPSQDWHNRAIVLENSYHQQGQLL